jgi:hypothetical protein
LSEKDDQLRKQDQGLAEKERQLHEKVKQLELKEKYILKILDSYAYKIGRTLFFPFTKIKKLLGKKVLKP